MLKQQYGTEISAIKGIKKDKKNNKEEQNTEEKNSEEQKAGENTKNETTENNAQTSIEQAKTGQETQVVTNNPIKETYNAQYGK